jgi:hypothetical protein
MYSIGKFNMDNVILFIPISEDLIKKASRQSQMNIASDACIHTNNSSDLCTLQYDIPPTFNDNPLPVPYAVGDYYPPSSGDHGHPCTDRGRGVFSGSDVKDDDIFIADDVFDNVFIQLERCNEQMEWPPHTSTYCYNCCHPFNTRPWFMPIGYHSGVFIVESIFCSPSCVMRYNYDSKHHEFSTRQSLLSLMIKMIYKSSVEIVMAPPKNILCVFGGKMTIDFYRKYSEDNSKSSHDIVIEYPPIYSIIPIIEMKKRVNTHNVSTKYVLYREKPLVRTQTSILDSMR